MRQITPPIKHDTLCSNGGVLPAPAVIGSEGKNDTWAHTKVFNPFIIIIIIIRVQNMEEDRRAEASATTTVALAELLREIDRRWTDTHTDIHGV